MRGKEAASFPISPVFYLTRSGQVIDSNELLLFFLSRQSLLFLGTHLELNCRDAIVRRGGWVQHPCTHPENGTLVTLIVFEQTLFLLSFAPLHNVLIP